MSSKLTVSAIASPVVTAIAVIIELNVFVISVLVDFHALGRVQFWSSELTLSNEVPDGRAFSYSVPVLAGVMIRRMGDPFTFFSGK